MKFVPLAISALLMTASTAAQAQYQNPKPALVAQAPAAQTEAQRSFALLKTLAGTWRASITAPDDPAMMPQAAMPTMTGKEPTNEVTIRVTSRGNAIVHELHDSSKPDDPARYDHPLTMLYLAGDHLDLTHYCDAGNRPHMVAKMSPDGNSVQFDMVDIVGPLNKGHMSRAVFTAIDENHHTEDCTYVFPGQKAVRFHFDLRRKSTAPASSDR